MATTVSHSVNAFGRTDVASPGAGGMFHVWVALLLTGAAATAETPLHLPDPGFETVPSGWSSTESAFSTLTEGAARTGRMGLRVADSNTTMGSSVRSDKVSVRPNQSYAVRFWSRVLTGDGLGVYVEFWDATGTILTTAERRNLHVFSVPPTTEDWTHFTIVARAPDAASALTVWIHSYNASRVTADLDDVSVARLTQEEAMSVKTSPTAHRAGNQFRVPTEARIAAIAAMLPPQPQGQGKPIHVREAWGPLRDDAAADGVIRRAETFADTPPPRPSR